jgi:hypothetical protein
MPETGDLDIEVFATVMAIDRRTRAPVVVVESYQPLRVLRDTMARPPAIDRPDFVSWGNVTRAELEALIRADYLWIDEDTLTAHSQEQVMWSIFSNRD